MIMRIISLAFLLPFVIYLANSSVNSTKLDAYSKCILQKVNDDMKKGSNRLLHRLNMHPFTTVAGITFVSMLLEVSDVPDYYEFQKLGCRDIIQSGSVFSLKVPFENFQNLLSKNWIKKAALSKKYKMNLDKSRSEIKADLVHTGINLPSSFQGENVIIGIFDTGIDFNHSDFSDENGTRILFLWDMSDETAQNPPVGFNWGREYTKTDIDQSPNVVLQKDFHGHGTHVAGIACGNGTGKASFKGIAPKSKIIVVKGVRNPYDDSFDDGDIIAGCSYIFSKAEELGMPCVINLSLGDLTGSHDGEDLLSKALDNLVSANKGRVIVVAAGNAGEYEIHSGGFVTSNERKDLLINPLNLCYFFPDMCPDLSNFFLTGGDIWAERNVLDSIYLFAIDRSSFDITFLRGFSANMDYSNVQLFSNNDELLGIFEQWTQEQDNSHNVQFYISNGGDTNVYVQRYYWLITLVAKNSGRVDSWTAIPIGSQYQISTPNSRFPSDNFMTVGSPGVAKNVVCVGSYVSKNSFTNILGREIDYSSQINLGQISTFSSRGPSRDGRTLPTILAPGQFVFSALSTMVNPNELDSNVIDVSGIYIGEQGTSMSAPHVTGAIALLLQFKPDLDYSQIIELVKKAGRNDSFTGSLPNNNAGWGKLDVLKLLQFVTSAENPNYSIKDFQITPNPTNSFVRIPTDENVEIIEVTNLFGRKLQIPLDNNVLDLSSQSSGVYFIKAKTNGKIQMKPIIKY